MELNISKEWILKMAELEDGCDYTVGGSLINNEHFIPMAWELPRDELDDKEIYILRLVGSHLKNFSSENKNKIIKLLREILDIKDLKRA